jgi:hypothetical protein
VQYLVILSVYLAFWYKREIGRQTCMKNYLILVIILSMLIFSACNKQGEKYYKSVSENDIITYSLNGNINKDRQSKFIDNVEKGIKDRISLVRYTTEGDPLITQLYFNGESIQIAIDNSNDKFAGKDKNKIIYNKINGGKQLKENLLNYLKDNHF